jgi:alpha-glucosidase
VPLYVREGAILPLRELEQYVGELAVNPITFNIYPGKDSSYQLYQDDHVSMANELSQTYRTTEISHTGIANGQTLRVKRTFDQFTPAETFYFISLLGTTTPSAVSSDALTWPNVGTPEALYNSTVNSYYYNASITTTFIKVFDTQPDISINVLF